MSENTVNQMKSEKLGMSHSTANNRLKKSVMFMLVKECNRDTCYRCGKKIEDVDNFSVEHIEDWLYSDNPKELFFDLNNITFSHHKCNVAEAQKKQKRRGVGSTGLKGVTYDKADGRYRARVHVDKKVIHVGNFHTAEEAGKAYDEKVIELFGENAVTNKSLGLL